MVSIAIDGTSGAGKSSIAQEIANKLGFVHMNTGALYRVIALECIQNNIDYMNEAEVTNFIKSLRVTVKFHDREQINYVNSKQITQHLHEPNISKVSSYISQYKSVRDNIKNLQRECATENNIVIEGRDICTEILPNADYKFFLTASTEVRAKRRLLQLENEGSHNLIYEDILKDIIERDRTDTTRKLCPLVIAKDAVVIDSSNLTYEETVKEFLKHITRR
ncbi:MAG: (d)CMP kinase [Candidatus Cloacimonetes bacterium]|nr:(d)CMP kinase [Candidatus Cloacimonadota bacterium]